MSKKDFSLALVLENGFAERLERKFMRVRTDEGEAFENFRTALDNQLLDLRLESDIQKS